MAQDLVGWFRSGFPADVEGEAIRCLTNAVGAGIGGAFDSTTEALFLALQAAAGPGDRPVIGRREGLPACASATVNAFAVTQNDFDDAHFTTILHPGAAALVAVLAVANLETSGVAALRAFALGCEAQLTLAVAISPSHYARGWHTTSSCASLGAAVAAGLLLGLDESGLAAAIDLAMLQVIGTRQAHGTHAKGYQVGKGASHGVSAALAVASGLDEPTPAVLGAHAGFIHGIADEMAGELRIGQGRWHLLDVGYKPYPAGMVCFGGIEAALAAAAEVDTRTIESIQIEIAPLVIELAGVSDPRDDSEARVSLPHAVAAALASGRAESDQFSPAAIEDPTITRLRRMVELVPRPEMPNSAAVLTIRTGRGARVWIVDEPLGGPSRPLSDDELEDKVSRLIAAVDPGMVGAVLAALEALPEAGDLSQFLTAVRLGRAPA